MEEVHFVERMPLIPGVVLWVHNNLLTLIQFGLELSPLALLVIERKGI